MLLTHPLQPVPLCGVGGGGRGDGGGQRQQQQEQAGEAGVAARGAVQPAVRSATPARTPHSHANHRGESGQQ